VDLVSNVIDSNLASEVAKFGAGEFDSGACMQCGTCAICPLSEGTNSFPRKIMRYIQMGLKGKLLEAPEPWLCYYCGDCIKDCPRQANPAEAMMATRRYLTAEYDWTGLAKRFYLSEKWEIGALVGVGLFVIMLFALFHGPVVTERVEVNTFAPVEWIEIGDLTLAGLLTLFLLSNAYRMFRLVMGDTKAPLSMYVQEAKTFILHFLTQRRWRECGDDRSRWLKHFLLVTGYLTMMALVIVFIRWFQTDEIHPIWHPTRLLGYYATIVLLAIPVEMMLSRRKKQEAIHQYSHFSDWLFLILLFATALTGILMHIFRLAGLPVTTYISYVVHLAIAVPMLAVEVPFGKWSHLFYRPLALFLTSVKKRAREATEVKLADVVAAHAGETFETCMQCGTCTALCPWGLVTGYSPREFLRQFSLGLEGAEEAVWRCVTCDTCGTHCPRGVEMTDVMRAVRSHLIEEGRTPEDLIGPLEGLSNNGNPWNGPREQRTAWAKGLEVPEFTPEHDYCLFTCCTQAYDPRNQKAAQALSGLLKEGGLSFGTLGNEESCCGDHALKVGAQDLFEKLARGNTDLFQQRGVKRALVASPHCLNAFRKDYPDLNGSLSTEHYTEVLDGLIAEGKLTPSRVADRTVTYHDPCYLGRQNGIYDAPRRVLESIPGLKLVEMPRSREESLCCGGGGGGAWSNYPAEERLGVLRVREALSTGAHVIATACPYCTQMLEDAVKVLGVEDRIEIRDVAELVAESVG
jgi:Fe-S oxidoreductase